MIWGAVTLVCLVVYVVGSRRLPQFTASLEHHVVGSFHVHSQDSHDSTVSLEAYVQAAQNSNLDFIVLTDHQSQKPQALTLGKVTVLSFAELNSDFGHLIGLGASRQLENNELRSLDIHQRMRQAGGSGIVAHPSDLKRPWVGPWESAGGLEIANLAASARRALGPTYLGLLPALAAWPLNRPLALAQLYDRDDDALARWDALNEASIVGLCGVDAHGWIDLGLNLRSWLVVVEDTLPTGPTRAAALLAALRRGRFHCVAGLLGHDPEFKFAAQHGGNWVAIAGDSIARNQVDQLVVRSPGHSEIVLIRDGSEISRTFGNSLLYADPQPGLYRVEIRANVPRLLLWGRRLPIIYSNRIRVMATALPPQKPQ